MKETPPLYNIFIDQSMRRQFPHLYPLLADLLPANLLPGRLAPPTRQEVEPLIRFALREDNAYNDATSNAIIPAGGCIRARVVAKAPGILAGSEVAAWTFTARDPSLRVTLKRHDGNLLSRGRTILVVEGSARSIFAAERTALNLLGHLSGIATLTHAFVQQVRSTRVKILDTRKTLPGLRMLEKYAVRMGGGYSHRPDLASSYLIKTNHLKALKALTEPAAYPPARSLLGRPLAHPYGRLFQLLQQRLEEEGGGVEIEITNLRELKQALISPQIMVILLDNWPIQKIRKAVALVKRHDDQGDRVWRKFVRQARRRNPTAFRSRGSKRHTPVEASGGVTLENVRAIARTGVDGISIGRLTHSAPALDVSLEVV